MAIIRWRDPSGIIPRWSLPSLWGDEDWISEEKDLSVYETDEDVIVKANVPGVPSDKVDISYEGGVITIKAEHGETQEEKDKKKAIYKEARQARYFYTTSIPTRIKIDQITASVKDGVVTVMMPKEEEAKPKRISVKAEER